MAQSNLTIQADPENKNNLTISFTRKNFQDFVYSLVSTPREVRKRIVSGYDLTKVSLKTIVDRLDQHINTNYDSVNREFVATIVYPEEHEITISSYDQFFSTEELNYENPNRIDLTISYIIGFNRSEGKKFEKQTVSISFFAGNPGFVDIRIRSTDLTWPIGTLNLLSNETLRLERNTAGTPPINKSYFIFSSLFRKSIDLNANFYRKSKKLRDTYLYISVLLSMFAAVIVLANSIIDLRQAYIYDAGSQKLVHVEATDLINDLGIEEAVKMLNNGATLNRVGALEYFDRYYNIKRFLLAFFNDSILITPTFGVFIFLYILLCYRHARILDNHYLARIVLTSDKPPRPRVSIADGLLFSILIGVLSSLFATLIVSFFGALP